MYLRRSSQLSNVQQERPEADAGFIPDETMHYRATSTGSSCASTCSSRSCGTTSRLYDGLYDRNEA